MRDKDLPTLLSKRFKDGWGSKSSQKATSVRPAAVPQRLKPPQHANDGAVKAPSPPAFLSILHSNTLELSEQDTGDWLFI